MGSDDVSAGFCFNAAASASASPRATGPAVFAKSKVSKRRGLNRPGPDHDQWEFPGVNPFPAVEKELNVNLGVQVEASAVAASGIDDSLRELSLGNDMKPGDESGIGNSSFDALARGYVSGNSLGKDGYLGSGRTDAAPLNELEVGDVLQVPFAEAVPLESICMDDIRNPVMETVADVASSAKASAKDAAFSSSSGSVPEGNGVFSFVSKQSHRAQPFAEFNAPSFKGNLVSSAEGKIEFAAKREVPDFSRFKKKKGKSKPSTHVPSHLIQGLGSNVDSSTGKQAASDDHSPMDVSPYQQMLGDNRSSSQTSTTSKDPNILDKDQSSDVSQTSRAEESSKDCLDQELIFAIQHMGINGKGGTDEADEDGPLYYCDTNIDIGCPVDKCLSRVASESFKPSTDGIEVILDDAIGSSQRSQASFSSDVEYEDDQKGESHNAAARAEGTTGSSFTFSASSSHQGQSLVTRRKTKKKPFIDAGCCSFKLSSCSEDSFTTAQSYLSSGVQATTSHALENVNQLNYPSKTGRQADSSSAKGLVIKSGSESISATTLAAQEACEKWRLRGNQAYTSGDALKAEECCTQGIDSIQKGMASRSCLRDLMLCYSNRAAVRMSLGRLNEAIQDCMMATALDPNFFKVQVRAANCFLSLGNINDALHYYKRCLQPGNDTCTDRKITVEASEGLEKSQKLSECMNQSAELLMRKTTKDVEVALEIIDEALLISPFSERLLQMKAEALFFLQKYEEVIQLCEDTIDSAEKNSSPAGMISQTNSEHESSRLNFKVWLCSLMFKSQFQLGRLEQGMSLIERNEISDLGVEQPLVDTARELLRLKTAGNEAFRAGRYKEAVENYTAALSCNVQSSPFAAICFCNRAAAYKASGQILDAIADCSLVIALAGNYIKAISRRAALFEMIRDYEQAVADLQRLASALTKQLEESTGRGGANDSLLSCAAELRQTRTKLAEMEEEARKDIPLDMYLILGVESSASMSEIKKAYRKAALRHHPDKTTQFLSKNENGDDKIWREIAEEVKRDADRLFKMIGVAYAILSDPVKRSQHDAEEEIRKAQKKHAVVSTSRTYKGASNPPPFERSVRQPHSEFWGYSSQQAQRSESSSWTRYK